MGAETSTLPTDQASSHIFCVTFSSYNILRVLDANEKVLNAVRDRIKATYPFDYTERTVGQIALDFELEGQPFAPEAPRKDNFFGRELACNVLECLLKSNCQLILGSGLLRDTDSSSNSWFFEESPYEELPVSVCCISLCQTDTLQLIKFPEKLVSVLQGTIEKYWPPGIETPFSKEFNGFELGLGEAPWIGEDKESVHARKLLLNIVRTMASHGWILCLCTNIRTMSDTLFFAKNKKGERITSEQVHDSFLLSFSSEDQLLVIDGTAEIHQIINETVSACWKPGCKVERQTRSTYVLKLGNNPWVADVVPSLHARAMVNSLLTKLRAKGWIVLETLFLYRRQNNKAVFFMAKTGGEDLVHWCVTLHHRNVMQFVNIPASVLQMFRELVKEKYKPGIKDDKIYKSFPQITFRGSPWGPCLPEQEFNGNYLMVVLLHAVSQSGGKVVCCADISSRIYDDNPIYEMDVHSFWVAMPDVTSTTTAKNA